MKYRILSLALALVFVVTAISGARAEMTRTEIEAIVKDYILNNGELILQSVTDYQTKGVAEKQQKALKANQRKLFNDEMSPVAGNPEGDIRIVEFFDYNCGYCKRVVGHVMRLLEEDDGVKFIFKDFPILGPTSELAARWALAADKQGKYLEFHRELLNSKAPVTEAELEDIAGKLDLDIEQLKKDAQSQAITDQIAKDRALAQELGISGTPGFVIEDEIFPGAMSYENMIQVIAAKRAAAAAEKDKSAE